MILGASEIVKRLRYNSSKMIDSEGKVFYKPLIENISESQVKGIEGTTVDLRLDKVFVTCGGAELLVDKRITPEIGELDPAEKDIYFIYPNQFVLVQTMETVNIPPGILGDVRNRTTLFRCGLYMKTAYISPNYSGVLTFALKNLSGHSIKIQRGFRIACISFSLIEGESVPYQGVWQGKRASTNGEVERPY
jgi:deoxycytidine triphosphate deaminase